MVILYLPKSVFCRNRYEPLVDMSFTEKEYFVAEKVMEELCTHPLAAPLLVSTESNQKNFTQIFTNLKNKSYINLSEFIQDFNETLISFSVGDPTDSPKRIIAEQIRKLFEKLITQLNNISTESWCKNVVKYKSQISKLLHYYPKKSNKFNIDPHQEIIDQEAEKLVYTVADIKSEDEHQEMVKIVTNLQPELETCNPELQVDFTMLHPKTLKTLKEYLETKKPAKEYKSC